MNNLAKLLQAASFAAKKHRYQKRKGDDAEPYVNHPLEVVNLLANVGKIEDYDILIAAVLHDTIEDTETTAEEITELFGEKVCGYVLEVTDDKSLPKAARKQHQVEHAPHLSTGAKQIKLGDKISNITDVTNNPPADWQRERRIEYVDWGTRVVAGLRGVNEGLENYFDEVVKRARAKFE
ncbi:MAG TPA: HD domain-containing protein [Pyrinomonadaceae bacterium]|jgi:guanosine-3',5'-bis(diphosphate) 3'-pyrophosphohydrolase